MVSVMRLSLDQLRRANTLRLPTFKNGRGEPAHSVPDGSDWSPGEWVNALVGELGEAANLIKKVHRGDYTLDEKWQDIADELADVLVYLDLLAMQLHVDLSKAIVRKFNLVSQRVSSPIVLEPDEYGNVVVVEQGGSR